MEQKRVELWVARKAFMELALGGKSPRETARNLELESEEIAQAAARDYFLLLREILKDFEESLGLLMQFKGITDRQTRLDLVADALLVGGARLT